MNNRFPLILVTVAALAFSGTALAEEKPNVLFIAVDDLNDWIGCMKGHPQALTPNMDRLAARGVLFTNAHCAAPACNPSRAAVFSGQMADVTGVWSNLSPSLYRLRPKAKLLPMAFSDAGYRTLGTGKLLHGSGEKKAFHEYFGVGQRWSPLTKKAVEYTDKELPSKGTVDPRHVVKVAHDRKIVLPLNRMPSDRKPDQKTGESFDWGPFDVPDSEMGDTQITDWAIKKMKRMFDKPFFLGVGYYRPHIPLWAPRKYFERFAGAPARLPLIKDDDLNDLSDVGRKWAIEPITAGRHSTVVKHRQWRSAVESYLACVTFVDHQVGRLLGALDKSSHADNTIIVLWSDHGWHLGEKGHWGKWTGWEQSTRVPLIIVPPRRIVDLYAVGSHCNQPVSLTDLYPTLTKLCDVTPPETLDGESLAPLLRRPKRDTGRAVITMFGQGNSSLRTKYWHYIRYGDGSEELYDHRKDPNEWNNLANIEEGAAQKELLNKMLSQFLARNRSQ
jgi:arylsulfatase A-like enzyme